MCPRARPAGWFARGRHSRPNAYLMPLYTRYPYIQDTLSSRALGQARMRRYCMLDTFARARTLHKSATMGYSVYKLGLKFRKRQKKKFKFIFSTQVPSKSSTSRDITYGVCKITLLLRALGLKQPLGQARARRLGILYTMTHVACIQDTLSSRAALGLSAVQPLGRVRRASKGILHTIMLHAGYLAHSTKRT